MVANIVLQLFLLLAQAFLVILLSPNNQVEEVPLKWMDRPSATEMERGRASEMDRRTSAKNMEMPLK